MAMVLPTELITWEVRWFFEGEISTDLKSMFRKTKTESRTDRYFSLDDAENTIPKSKGMKLREGGLEIKSLIQDMLVTGPPVKIQQWKKVRMEMPPDFARGRIVMPVIKNRQLIYYEFNGDNCEGPVSNYPKEGCNVELTRFKKPFDRFWTFGLEAYGDEPNARKCLPDVYDKIIKRNIEFADLLARTTPMSYPEWLGYMYGRTGKWH